jgi:quinol monooxygenase YgiN
MIAEVERMKDCTLLTLVSQDQKKKIRLRGLEEYHVVEDVVVGHVFYLMEAGEREVHDVHQKTHHIKRRMMMMRE